MGADSGGDKGLSLSGDSDEEEAEAEAEVEVEFAAAAELARIGSMANSRCATPTHFVDGVSDGGIGTLAPQEVSIAPVPPLQSTTHQFAKGVFYNAPHYQPIYGQALFMPDVMLRPQQQLYQPPVLARQRPAAQQLVTALVQQQPVLGAQPSKNREY